MVETRDFLYFLVPMISFNRIIVYIICHREHRGHREEVRYVLEISDLFFQDAVERLNGIKGMHDVSIMGGVLQVHADIGMRHLY